MENLWGRNKEIRIPVLILPSIVPGSLVHLSCLKTMPTPWNWGSIRKVMCVSVEIDKANAGRNEALLKCQCVRLASYVVSLRTRIWISIDTGFPSWPVCTTPARAHVLLLPFRPGHHEEWGWGKMKGVGIGQKSNMREIVDLATT